MLNWAMAALLAAAPAAAQTVARPNAESANIIDGITVAGTLPPVPQIGAGAPMFSAPELAAEANAASRSAVDIGQACNPYNRYVPTQPMSIERLYYELREAQGDLRDAAEAAEGATARALKARIQAGANPSDTAAAPAMEAAEIARQNAVKAFLAARDKAQAAEVRVAVWQEGMLKGHAPMPGQPPRAGGTPMEVILEQETAVRLRKRTAAANAYPLLKVDQIRGAELGDHGLRVAGLVNNIGPKAQRLPSLTFSFLDARGLVISQTTSVPAQAVQIAPGKSVPFGRDFTDPPAHYAKLTVTLGGNSLAPPLLRPDSACSK